MNISPVSSMPGADALRQRPNNIADTRAGGPQRLEQTEAVGRPQSAQQSGQASSARQSDQPAPSADSYEPGIAAAAYAAGTRQPDIARDVTDTVSLRNAYAANAAVAERQNETTGTTIDLIG